MDFRFDSDAEINALKCEDLRPFSAFKLRHVKQQIKTMLGFIGRNNLFHEYTKHDIEHINDMLDLTSWIIPETTKSRMTPTDWLMVVLSIYFHDLGLLVTQAEYKNRNKTDFKLFYDAFKPKANQAVHIKSQPQEYESFVYQEFVRHNHARRIGNWIRGESDFSLGDATAVWSEIQAMLKTLPARFRMDLALVCESHHLDDLGDFDKYQVSYPYDTNPSCTANIHYCAVMLRTVDLLQITNSRAPTIEYRLINPTDPYSQTEWQKHNAVTAVRALPIRGDGVSSGMARPDTIQVAAYFDSPDKANGFFALIAYLNYVRGELSNSYKWCEQAKKAGSKFEFPWRYINDELVETKGFERRLFEFTLDQNKILNLLVGHTLYNDSTVVLRELVQNSIDAIRLRDYEEGQADNQTFRRSGRSVQVDWDAESRLLQFVDNGTGMTREIIDNHLLKIGSSRYQDVQFKRKYPGFHPISRFGIGILTCFLIADDIEITTYSEGEEKPLQLTIKNVDGKYLLRQVEKSTLHEHIRNKGTCIKLKVRLDVDCTDVERDLKKWILYPACDVIFSKKGEKGVRIGFDGPKEALFDLIKARNMNENKYDVIEKTVDGVSVACIVKFDKYFHEWQLVTVDPRRFETEELGGFNPIGTAVEGIRVEFSTPGFSTIGVLASANVCGPNTPRTNVARSFIESGPDGNFLLERIYKSYASIIDDEIVALGNRSNRSITWSASESEFLLTPLTGYRSDNTAANQGLLDDAISTIRCVIVEKDASRKLVANADVWKADRIWTINSELHKSAELLLRESSRDLSLAELLKTLDGIGMEKDALFLCSQGYNSAIVHRALKGKGISKVKVYTEGRRVDVEWSTAQASSWAEVMEEVYQERRRRFVARNNYIQILPINNFDLAGKVTAFSVHGRVYWVSGSPFHSLMLDCYNEKSFGRVDSDLLGAVLEIGLVYLRIYDGEAPDLEAVNRNLDDWNYGDSIKHIRRSNFDMNKLAKALAETKWSRLDSGVWSRQRNDDEY